LSPNIGKGFNRYCENVTNALLDGIGRSPPEELADMRVACSQVVLCVSQECVTIFCNVLEETSATSKNPAIRGAVAQLIASFTSNTRTNFDSQLPLLMQILLRLFNESGELLQAAWDALDATMKSVPEEKQAKHISFVRSVLSDIAFDQYELKKRDSVAGFNLKKGIAPLLPMMQYGLMHGSSSVRVDAADGLSDLIRLTNEAALGPFVIKITGPLIRIVGDRFPADVKTAILNTLYLLLVKAGKHLKPFIPQLQSTMIKALSDASASVRSRGGLALAELLTEPKRATTVLAELVVLVNSDAATAVRTSALQAMNGICMSTAISGQLAPETLQKNISVGLEHLGSEQDQIRRESAKLIAVNAQHLGEAELSELINVRLLKRQVGLWIDRDGIMSALQACVRTCGPRIEPHRAAITKLAMTGLADPHTGVLSAAILLAGELMLHAAKTNDLDSVVSLAAAIIPQLVSNETAQVRLDAASRFQLLGEVSADASTAVYDTVVPGLVARAQDPNGPVRQAVVGACHTLFQFHVADGFEAAEKRLGAYHTRAMKKNANDAQALILFAKKSVARAKPSPVEDDLWASTKQGETLADPNAAKAEEEEESEEEDDDSE